LLHQTRIRFRWKEERNAQGLSRKWIGAMKGVYSAREQIEGVSLQAEMGEGCGVRRNGAGGGGWFL
jgi:hypothetical protein